MDTLNGKSFSMAPANRNTPPCAVNSSENTRTFQTWAGEMSDRVSRIPLQKPTQLPPNLLPLGLPASGQGAASLDLSARAGRGVLQEAWVWPNR